MRGYLVVAAMLLVGVAHAGSGTLRVGSQVLTVGDSATRVTELLGKPTHKGHAASGSGSRASGKKKKGSHAAASGEAGERWQYRQGDRVVTITLADGKVTAIRDDGR